MSSDRFPTTLEQRFEQAMRRIGKDIKGLKQAAVLLEPGCLVTPYQGTIDAGYTSGRPMVDLATGTTIGPCPYLAQYTPAAGDTVLLVPVGQTYIVIGRIV
jgi:hypothetical protein